MTEVERIARAARAAGRRLAKATAGERTAALTAIAGAVERNRDQILEANAEDVGGAEAARLSPAMIDRLRLDPARLGGVVAAVRQIAARPDPVGVEVQSWIQPNGLRVARRRIPIGVVAVIYEARPNVTCDAAALCLRAGNAAILRGGSEALASNRALGRAIAEGLERAGMPAEAVQVLGSPDRAEVAELLACDADIDLVIPRGGEGLIRFVTERSRVPVLRHARGNCHVFVERTASESMALEICYNAKVQRPGVCNAAETILIDEAIAANFVPKLAARLSQAGVEMRGDETARALWPAMTPATPDDFHAEFLDLICAVGVVAGVSGAIQHIERYGSSHTEAIVTSDAAQAERFVREIDSSTVLVNASTRFADGGELGLGAEIGISTTRLHAYGPMGADELTVTKFVVFGEGQTRS